MSGEASTSATSGGSGGSPRRPQRPGSPGPGPRRPPGRGRAANPFAVEHVAPGAIGFDPGDARAAGLDEIERALAAAGGAGVVLGAHGSGKTTLLVHLVRRAEAAGRPARLVRFERDRAGGRRSTVRTTAWPVPRPRERLALDAGGDHGRLGRWRLARRVRRLARRVRAAGGDLVLAAHREVGLPVVHHREVTAAQAARIVRGLLDAAGATGAEVPDEGLLAEALARHDGSLREVLFECYDRWERGWETPGSPRG